MKVTLLIGSVRPERQTHKVARYIQKQLLHQGIEVDMIDLAEENLPVFGTSQNEAEQSRISEISKRLDEASAMIFVTPEYHGSFSGALKNALDYYWVEFQRKTIGVVAGSSGKMGGINASTQLQHVVLSLGAYPLPVKLLVPEVHLAFNQQEEPTDERFARSAEKFLKEFLWYAEAINEKKTREAVVA